MSHASNGAFAGGFVQPFPRPCLAVGDRMYVSIAEAVIVYFNGQVDMMMAVQRLSLLSSIIHNAKTGSGCRFQER